MLYEDTTVMVRLSIDVRIVKNTWDDAQPIFEYQISNRPARWTTFYTSVFADDIHNWAIAHDLPIPENMVEVTHSFNASLWAVKK